MRKPLRYTTFCRGLNVPDGIPSIHRFWWSFRVLRLFRLFFREKFSCTFCQLIQKFTTGNIYITREEYNEAFCVFCLSAIEANKLHKNINKTGNKAENNSLIITKQLYKNTHNRYELSWVHILNLLGGMFNQLFL